MDLFDPAFYTVSEITAHIQETLESNPLLQDLWLVGQVSNYTRSTAGHVYLTLKDADAQIRCVMWRSMVVRQAYLPSTGEEVLVHGHVSVYAAGGNYQFYMDVIQPKGIGQLYLAFEALKERLAAEGLFAAERKRPLPPMPRCIGVVTSPTGAALRDILNILRRRYPLVRVILSPTLVQGAEAPGQIVAALERLSRRPEVDLIIVARGGGSIEDLWAFNDEGVARAIYAAPVPVISGVGHETDFTIADLVADVRAPTPSAAAELATPDREALQEQVAGWRDRLVGEILGRLEAQHGELAHLRQVLGYHSPRNSLAQWRQRLDERAERAVRAMAYRLDLQRERLSGNALRLQSLSPLRALERGYAIVRRADDGIVSSVDQVKAGDKVRVQVRDGAFGALVQRPEGER